MEVTSLRLRKRRMSSASGTTTSKTCRVTISGKVLRPQLQFLKQEAGNKNRLLKKQQKYFNGTSQYNDSLTNESSISHCRKTQNPINSVKM